MSVDPALRVADEVWIATALLHRENPGKAEFSIDEIVDRARGGRPDAAARPGLRTHAQAHCVASKKPQPATYRMLTAAGKKRRLFKLGDPAHPDRAGKMVPERDEIPERYHYLLDWYEQEYARGAEEEDPFLAMEGLYSEIWEGVDPDEYIRELREGWE